MAILDACSHCYANDNVTDGPCKIDYAENKYCAIPTPIHKETHWCSPAAGSSTERCKAKGKG